MSQRLFFAAKMVQWITHITRIFYRNWASSIINIDKEKASVAKGESFATNLLPFPVVCFSLDKINTYMVCLG